MYRKILFAASLSALFAIAVLGQSNTTTPATAAASTTNAAPKKPAIFRPTKDQIQQVQTILKGKKLYAGDANGSYNDDTRAGIKSFQKDNGLKETGTLNRATLEKFGVALTDKQKEIPVSQSSYATSETSKTSTKPITGASTASSPSSSKPDTTKRTIFRATTDQIKSAQKLLKSKSMYAGDETGKLDDATREGLKKYQEANSVKVTGTLNAVTLEKMGISLTDKQKADAAASGSTTTTNPKK
jgi:peptidoglycan hydrolase-like protein with peptidoglycan-binding domain